MVNDEVRMLGGGKVSGTVKGGRKNKKMEKKRGRLIETS